MEKEQKSSTLQKLTNSQQRGGATKKIKYFGKIILSGILATFILNILISFYYNIPIQDKSYDLTKNKITRYKYEPIENYTRGIEGFGKGRINNDGYVNIHDYNSNLNINILIMGSSQIEAFQVDIKENTSTILEELLKNKIVYNIGISGHKFLENVSRIKLACEKYKPNDYVIIETSDINFSEENLMAVINNKLIEKNNSETNKIMAIIRQSPILRNAYRYSPLLKLLFQQIQDLRKVLQSGDDTVPSFNYQMTDKLLKKIKTDVKNINLKVIIMYHPTISLANDGSLILSSEHENVKEFKEICEQNGILFLDMSDRFKEEYKNNYILPYGFSNTSVGTGHLNKYGHEMIADELYKIIKGVE